MFRPATPIPEKRIDEHPWTRRIKDTYLRKINHAHNSIRNPEYPKKSEKKNPEVTRIKFTIIGDRVTKEFIYCTHLVKGLFKYRKNTFDTPVIRGVTTVEWPTIWNDLKIRFDGQIFALRSSVAVLINGKFLGGEKELRELIESKFTYYLCFDYHKESLAEFGKFIRGSGRPSVYMNISLGGNPIGTLIFMLYADLLPLTCDNFLRLCKETKGGYSGTPIHRIVKDGWIQGGGFGLKETDLHCENFVIPHDKRGVLCMANSGLHEECSTQFFVLLQPAPWMAKKFVAFGQLIEGKGTLETIEAVPTWYESPTSEIKIYKAGIYNMDCQGIMINTGTNEYIDKHIEDSNEFGALLYVDLIQKVFVTALLKELESLEKPQGEGSEENNNEQETQRYNYTKKIIKKELLTIKTNRPMYSVSRQTTSTAQRPASATADENNEFDVETYDPEYEETDYQHKSIYGTPSLIIKPKKPFYLPLTDVPYPDEKDSEFDLKRFLQGYCCLESDLTVPAKTFIPRYDKISFKSEQLSVENQYSSGDDDSDEDNTIKEFLKNNFDRLSFAGGIVRGIAKREALMNIFEEKRKSEQITDDQLRRLRLAWIDSRTRDQREHKVSISTSIPGDEQRSWKIKRRQTGFIRPEDLKKLKIDLKLGLHEDGDDEKNDEDEKNYQIEKEDEPGRKVRIAAPDISDTRPPVKRRVTAFMKHPSISDDDDDDSRYDKGHTEGRPSVLDRLFDEYKEIDEQPTLKDYKPKSETQARSLLTFSSNYPIKGMKEGNREKYIRVSVTSDEKSFEALSLQHGRKTARKISSDYVQAIDYIQHRGDISIRSVEYARMRPSISVSEYQQKNKIYQAAMNNQKQFESKGLRLPGDSPLYHSEIALNTKNCKSSS